MLVLTGLDGVAENFNIQTSEKIPVLRQSPTPLFWALT